MSVNRESIQCTYGRALRICSTPVLNVERYQTIAIDSYHCVTDTDSMQTCNILIFLLTSVCRSISNQLSKYLHVFR